MIQSFSWHIIPAIVSSLPIPQLNSLIPWSIIPIELLSQIYNLFLTPSSTTPYPSLPPPLSPSNQLFSPYSRPIIGTWSCFYRFILGKICGLPPSTNPASFSTTYSLSSNSHNPAATFVRLRIFAWSKSPSYFNLTFFWVFWKINDIIRDIFWNK